MLRGDELVPQVDRHALFPEGRVDLGDLMAPVVGRVVDQDRQPVAQALRPVQRRRQGCVVSDVGGDEMRVASGLLG